MATRPTTPIAERIAREAWRIFCGGEVTVEWIMGRFQVSRQTAQRDMLMLERALVGKRDAPPRKGRKQILTRHVIRVELMPE